MGDALKPSRRRFIAQAATVGLGGALLSCARSGRGPKRLRGGKPPNVLWIMTDDQRPDSLGCYGTPWARTPNIDYLAERGVLFRHAVSQCPVCMPSRTSMFTGYYCHRIGLLENVAKFKVPPSARALTWPFIEAGYHVANIGKLDFRGKNPFKTHKWPASYGGLAATPFGLRKPYDPKKLGVLNLPTPLGVVIAGTYPLEASRTEPAMAVDAALELLDQGLPEPFLLRVSIIAPHTPVLPPKPYDTMIDPASIALPLPTREQLEGRSEYEKKVLGPFQSSLDLTVEQIARARAHYYGYVTFVDSQVGRLLRAMKARGLTDNLLIVFNSDQGIELGEHGIFMKRNFYEQTVCSPLIISWPGRLPEGLSIDRPVELIDLMPTMLDLAGLRVPEAIDGRSLVPLIEGRKKGWPEAVFSEIDYSVSQWKQLRPGGGRRVMVRTERWKMCLFAGRADKDGELYDLARDPGETKNLYRDRRHRRTIARLERLLERWNSLEPLS